MLTYEDCLGLCELGADEIAAIARHEHVPEILALELGAHLCTTAEGRRVIRGMIADDAADARARGDLPGAARLEQVLQHFAATYPDQPPAPASELPSGVVAPLGQRVRALGFDADSASWVSRRVESYLTAMAQRFGLDLAGLPDSQRLERLAAETRCAACRDTARCRRYLAGGAGGKGPAVFCPNAPWFQGLQGRG